MDLEIAMRMASEGATPPREYRLGKARYLHGV